MITVEPILTTGGKGLFTRAAGGETLTFTKFQIGDGQVPSGLNPESLTTLRNARLTFSISSIDTDTPGYVKLNGGFDSSAVQSDFVWREIGLFAKGSSDDTETLYAYANDGDNAGTIRVNTTGIVMEQNISFIVAIGDAENVTAIISQSNAYALKTDFDAHVADRLNPHEVSKAQIGLGNVPNVTTNDQTPTYTLAGSNQQLASGEKLSIAFGKIAKAVKSLISHIGSTSNPHNVTSAQIGAASMTHAHNAVDITDGVLPVNRGGTAVTTYGALRDKLGLGSSVSEPLAVTRGGTGATSVGDLRNALGLGTDASAPLAVDHGGTGGTTLEALRGNLGLGSATDQPLGVIYGGTGIDNQPDFDARFAFPVVWGNYTGDGTANRVLTLGFTPRFVIVYSAFGSIGGSSSGRGLFFAPDGGWATTLDCTDIEHAYVPGHTMSSSSHVAFEVVENGLKFYATSANSANYNGRPYSYAAFR